MCLTLVYVITLVFEGEQESSIPEKVALYQINLNDAIQEGRLQNILDLWTTENRGNVVVLTTVSEPTSAKKGLSDWAILAIVVAVLAFLIPVAYFMIKSKRREKKEGEEEGEYSFNKMKMNGVKSRKEQRSQKERGARDTFVDEADDAANAMEVMETGTKGAADQAYDVASSDGSSSAGGSGWSSSEGISSMNTGSVDDSSLDQWNALATMGAEAKMIGTPKTKEQYVHIESSTFFDCFFFFFN